MQKLSILLMACLVMAFSSPSVEAETVDVIVGPGGDFVFEAAEIEINLGDTVRWTWDSDGHNVGSGLPGNPTPYFLSGPPEPSGTVFELLFDGMFLLTNSKPANLYDYHCHPHGDFGMVGSIQVNTLTGDVNLDGAVTLLDVVPFVNLLSAGGYQFETDVNGDGVLNLLDVDPFVALLSGE